MLFSLSRRSHGTQDHIQFIAIVIELSAVTIG